MRDVIQWDELSAEEINEKVVEVLTEFEAHVLEHGEDHPVLIDAMTLFIWNGKYMVFVEEFARHQEELIAQLRKELQEAKRDRAPGLYVPGRGGSHG